ncbi:MAG: hypothetical protein ACLR7Z_15265 [Bilophila wadsworthia]
MKEVYFDTFYQEIRPEIIEGLNAIAAEEQISLNALLLAAYFKLMNVWCHQDDMIINMPCSTANSISPGPARPWAASSTSGDPSSRSPARPRRSPASFLRCPSPPSSSPASCSSGRACAPRP